ncbi:cation:proton antiporter [Micromonospora auratinigra]|uniref:Kef-type K+ transport system, membrane component KefB n=1 Tax=Micromonospora auratinigra TaxID=261654 RepID=A0A1A8ZFK5_9ACTN|nr:cation:proton antiporter [Micromonospora auratinigra]SBT42795.1 Kef-type K+ transport system, membrane component KefB [Micromonospora auratinigra]
MSAVSDRRPDAGGPRRHLIAWYAVLVVGPLLLALLLLSRGGHADDRSAVEVPTHAPDVVSHLLLSLPVVFAACWAAGWAFRRLGQPAVIGEIVAGVLLGPSLLGWLWPAAYHALFPPVLLPAINVLAQVGLVLFMFLVGYELNLALVRRRGQVAVLVSNVSIAVPFLAGVALAFGLRSLMGPAVNFLGFALFLAVSMSVTAFPVLARILHDRGMSRQPVASLALACAAVDDITAWCLLALSTAVAAGTSGWDALWTAVLTVAFVALMLALVRPLLARLVAPPDGRRPLLPPSAVLPFLLGGLMVSALITDRIGIHPVFGAFLFGVVTPRGVRGVVRATRQVHGLTLTLLLPLFFVVTGLRTRFGLLGSDVGLWGRCALIVVVAVAAKWAASTLVARLSGVDRWESWSLGVLLNCRGLTELVVLNIGLELGIIDQTLFTMLVIMALVSTVLTSPALSLIDRIRRRHAVPAEPAPVAG